MTPCLSARHYVDEAGFARERSEIFEKTWSFAGFRRDLEGHADYICCEVAGKSVVLQNFQGVVKAFQNVCAHRFSRIRSEKKGRGLLRCPYHGLTYGADGIPVTIPAKIQPEDGGDIRQTLVLNSWDVETCGELVFVRKSPNGPPLRDFLARALPTLEKIGDALGPLLDENELIIESNWKIAVENTLESAHVGSVHPQSFARLGLPDAIEAFEYQNVHSSWNAPVDNAVQARWDKLSRVFEGRPYVVDGYFHQFIFPNLTIATTYGSTFSLQVFQPLTVSSTKFTSYVFATKRSGDGKANAASEALYESAVAFNRSVFEEDARICGLVQLGALEADSPGFLSKNERRVRAFQESYIAAMEGQPN